MEDAHSVADSPTWGPDGWLDGCHVNRKEFVSLIAQIRDGRVLTGLPIAQDAAGLTMVNAKNERIVLVASEVEVLRESSVSRMPDDLYRQLSPQSLRDLFAYLQSSEPPPGR